MSCKRHNFLDIDDRVFCTVCGDPPMTNKVHPIFQPIIDLIAPPQRAEEREHVESAGCWCNPTLDYVDQETGAKHWIHHEPS